MTIGGSAGVETEATSETIPVTNNPTSSFLPRRAASWGVPSMILVLAAFFGCDSSTSDRNADGGSGVDVPNSLHARLLSSGTCRADGAQVRIRPANWTPFTGTTSPGWDTTSSADGSFAVALTDTGSWVLEARDSAGGCGAIRTIDTDSLKGRSLVQLGALVLEKFGSIEGALATAGSGTDSAAKWSIVIPGVDVVATPDGNGIWRIELVSAGSYTPIAVFKGVPEQVPIGQVQVAPQATTIAPPTVVAIQDGSTDRVVRGRATTSTGARAAGGSVKLLDISGSGLPDRGFVVDDSGRYAFALPDSGSWILRIACGQELFADTLEPSDLSESVASTRTRLSLVRLEAAASLSGAILMPIGVGTAPGSPSEWIVTIEGAGERTSSRAEASGQFLFTGLAAGTYSLSAANANTSRDTSLGSLAVASGTATRAAATTITSGMADPGLEWIEGRAGSAAGPAAKARIVALPESVGIAPPTSKRQQVLVDMLGMSGTADDSGRFSLQFPESTPYRLVVLDSSGKTGRSLPWGPGTDTSTISDLRLLPLGSSRIRLDLPPGLPNFHRYSGFTWSILGTTRRISTSSPDVEAPLRLDSLAPGDYRSVVLDVNTGKALPFEFPLRIPSGGTFDTTLAIRPSHLEDSSAWKSQARLEVVPPQDAIDIAGFPLRLRLDSFVDFASSSADGHDIRILDAKGNWLPVWFSRWEPAAHRAEAWVLLDTLRGGRPTELTVRSGNPTAATLSNFSSDSVFRPQDGWIGAWSGSDGRSLMAGTPAFELSSVRSDTGFSDGGMRFDSFSRAVAKIPDGAIAQGYTLLVNLSTTRSEIDVPSYFGIQSNSGHQTHALWAFREFGDTAKPLVMCKDVVDNTFFGSPDLPVPLVADRWTQFVFAGSGDSSIVAQGFLDGEPDAQVVVRPAPPLSGASEIVLGGVVPDTTGFEGIVGEVRLFRGAWSSSRRALEARNWDPRSTWIRRKP